MPNELPYEQLEAYLNDHLDATERSAFEQRLRSSAELQAELALYRQIREAQRDTELDAFEAQLDAAYQKAQTEYSAESATASSPWRRWIWWLLAILLLLGLFLTYRAWSAAPPEPAQLYAEYSAHDFAFQEMNAASELGEIEALLQAGQYAAALPRLQAFVQNNPDRPDVRLALGIALRETGQIRAAIQSFTELGSSHPLYSAESKWQIALTYLKDQQLSACRQQLERIPAASSRYPAAQQLKNALAKAQEE